VHLYGQCADVARSREFGVEGQDLTVSPSAGGVGQRGIDKAQPGSVLPGKAIQRCEEKIRAGREFQFFGFRRIRPVRLAAARSRRSRITVTTSKDT
jgi:hypothetical protein